MCIAYNAVEKEREEEAEKSPNTPFNSSNPLQQHVFCCNQHVRTRRVNYFQPRPRSYNNFYALVLIRVVNYSLSPNEQCLFVCFSFISNQKRYAI